MPFSARQLTKHDIRVFEPLLAEFLYIQKQKDIYEMDDREVRGRWKSFVGKWNRGELAEGWYDPEFFARIMEREPEAQPEPSHRGPADTRDEKYEGDEHVDGSSDEDYGPILPGGSRGSRPSGPGIPSRQDLALRDEQRQEDREAEIEALRAARKAERSTQKERLDDLTPRAEAGTRERKLEKKQLLNEKLSSFREKSPGAEVPEADLMGGGDELADLKREKMRVQRRKTEREVRREEEERIKMEEIEEKRRRYKEREDGTVNMLRELARQRFGNGQ